jgi:hypothetical protein
MESSGRHSALANVEVQRQRSPLTIEILAPTFM